MDELQNLRRQIDGIDGKIAILLQKRAVTVGAIKKLKKEKGLQPTDPDREKEILSRVESDYEREIFKKILEESRKL